MTWHKLKKHIICCHGKKFLENGHNNFLTNRRQSKHVLLVYKCTETLRLNDFENGNFKSSVNRLQVLSGSIHLYSYCSYELNRFCETKE